MWSLVAASPCTLTLPDYVISAALARTRIPLSDYSVEYLTALLMNLSLRSAGKHRAAKADLGTLDVLSEYLETENEQVRAYINGTLYSLLSHVPIRAQARAIGLADILQALLRTVQEEQFARQLQFILQQLDSQEAEVLSDNEEGGAEDEDEDEEDEWEDERGLSPSINAKGGELAGEHLLCARYLATDIAAATKQLQEATAASHAYGPGASSSTAPPRDTDNGMLLRPTTPGAPRHTRKQSQSSRRLDAPLVEQPEGSPRPAVPQETTARGGGGTHKAPVSGIASRHKLARTPPPNNPVEPLAEPVVPAKEYPIDDVVAGKPPYDEVCDVVYLNHTIILHYRDLCSLILYRAFPPCHRCLPPGLG